MPKPAVQETAISRESLWRKTQSRIFGAGPKGLRQSTNENPEKQPVSQSDQNDLEDQIQKKETQKDKSINDK